jgi:HK97 family phage prohead protease
MDRAYATLTIKQVDQQRRTFRGIATTVATDRMDDVVESRGAQFKLPIPLLWQHDQRDPIGWVRTAKVSDSGIEIEGEIADVPDSGPLKERLTLAWQYIKSNLVRGLSIGFNPLEAAEIEGSRWGRRYLKWEWLELSAVTIPANQEATIVAVKSFAARSAASGLGTQLPGASGSATKTGKGQTMKTIHEQLAELREALGVKTARLTEIKDASATEKRAMSQDERTEFDQLLADVESLGDEIRVKQAEALVASTAQPVSHQRSFEGAADSRGPAFFVKRQDPDDKYQGQAMTRFFIAKALAYMQIKEGNFVTPGQIAEARWGKTHPKLVQYIKAAVAGAGTGSGEWGAELAQSDERYTGDFIEFLYSRTVFDRLPLRPVPSRVHIKGQDGAATGYWVGESKAINVSKADFSDVELTPLKVGAIAVCSKEWVMDASPSGEMLIRDSIVEASAQRVDSTFLSTTAATNGVSPAGILNGVTITGSAGTDADALRYDIKVLYDIFIAAKNASGLAWVMTPGLAKAISLMRNAFGQVEFPGLTATGGMLEGDAVFTGDNVGAGDLILMKPSDIWKIGDRGIQVSMTDQATIEQDNDPQGESDTPTAASATLVSLWQTESIGFKVVRPINFAKRRTSAVAYIGAAEYGTVSSA